MRRKKYRQQNTKAPSPSQKRNCRCAILIDFYTQCRNSGPKCSFPFHLSQKVKLAVSVGNQQGISSRQKKPQQLKGQIPQIPSSRPASPEQLTFCKLVLKLLALETNSYCHGQLLPLPKYGQTLVSCLDQLLHFADSQGSQTPQGHWLLAGWPEFVTESQVWLPLTQKDNIQETGAHSKGL